jgi:hypothetical protein
MDATTLMTKVQDAIKDCRDKLDRVPGIHKGRTEGELMVWVNGWWKPEKETEATKKALEAAGLTIVDVSYDDLGDDDCPKWCGFIYIRA